jgi:futalosine hydrolase
MKLLLVAATKAELGKVFEHYSLKGDDFVTHPKFDVLITGVGMTATAFALGKHLGNNYNLVLNVGIAGSFDQNISLGSLVNIETDTFAELGAEDHEDFLTIDQLGFGKNTYNSCYTFDDLPKVNGITVNKVHGNTPSIAKALSRFKPQTESMEGAAVFYACEMQNITCLQIRAISNFVEPRNKENWQINLAITNLNNWVIEFIEARL